MGAFFIRGIVEGDGADETRIELLIQASNHLTFAATIDARDLDHQEIGLPEPILGCQ